ncbi:MAG: type IV pilus assembly protein PilM, partial [bacterium]
YLVTHAGSTPTPPDAIKQGVVDNQLAVAEAIHTLLQTLGIKTPLAVAAVAGPSVVIRQVQLPSMPESQLRKSIYWEARNYITFPVEDSLVELQILGTSATDGTPQMDVMLAATPRDLVDRRVQALELAELDPIAIELEPFALMRSTIELLHGSQAMTETVALVDIGATYTSITVVSDGVFKLTRSVAAGGNALSEAIASAMGISVSQAEEVKENEVKVVTDEVDRAMLTPLGQEASRALEPQLEELVREIRRSFAFYDYQRTPGAAEIQGISRVILTGGTARLNGLSEYLTGQLGVPVQLLNLFQMGALLLPEGAEGLDTQLPLLSTALGLALREPMLAFEKEPRR